LNDLMSEPVEWDTAGPERGRNWAEVVAEKAGNEKTNP